MSSTVSSSASRFRCCLSGHTDDVLQVQRYAYPPDRPRDHVGGRVRAATLAGTSTGPTPARFPVIAHRIGNRHHPIGAATHCKELIRPVSNLPAVLIIWPAAASITDANPRAIGNVAATASPGLGEAKIPGLETLRDG